MKERGGDRLKCAINESTLSTADAVPLPQWRRLREGGFAAKKEANPASLRSAAPSKGRGSRGHSLLPLEGGAPKGRRLAHNGMKRNARYAFSPFRPSERSRGMTIRGCPYVSYKPKAHSPLRNGLRKTDPDLRAGAMITSLSGRKGRSSG